MKMPSLSHWVLTNSNWRFRCAPAKTKMMPAVGAVVLEHALGQHRPVARAAPDHAVQAHVDAAVVVERVARVRPARVGAGRALEAARVVAVEEVVVALRVGAELGVVAGPGRARAARRSASARPSSRRAAPPPRGSRPSRGGTAGRRRPGCAACGRRRRCRCGRAPPGSASAAARRSRPGSRG